MTPRDLDALCSIGEVVWAGIEPIGSNDGRIALYLAEHEALLARAVSPIGTDQAAAVRASLARRGAVFFAELLRDTGGFPNDVLSTLWDMVWAGEVTNDSLEALRSLLRPASSKRDGRSMRLHASRRSTQARLPGSEGRWSLRSARWPEPPSDTERRTALARSLLERYGVVTREVAHAEGLEGGFSSVYEILKVMESSGRIRRGYFVAGHGGAAVRSPWRGRRPASPAHTQRRRTDSSSVVRGRSREPIRRALAVARTRAERRRGTAFAQRRRVRSAVSWRADRLPAGGRRVTQLRPRTQRATRASTGPGTRPLGRARNPCGAHFESLRSTARPRPGILCHMHFARPASSRPAAACS